MFSHLESLLTLFEFLCKTVRKLCLVSTSFGLAFTFFSKTQVSMKPKGEKNQDVF